MTCRQHLQRFLASLIFVASACSQSTPLDYTPYQPLSATPLVANSGMFLWPQPGSVELYEVGSMMNISWSSKFSRVNLWLVPNSDGNTYPLLSNTSSVNFEWIVQCLGDCQIPWLVRATDAESDAEAQMNSGFISTEFRIMPAGENSTSASSGPASTGPTSTSTTMVRITRTITPRLTITLNSTTASTGTTTATSDRSAITETTSVMTTTASSTPAMTASRTPEPTTTPLTQGESSTTTSAQQTGNAVKGVELVVGIAVAAAVGVVIGWHP
ncbi:uncharacterized protein RCC_07674 [Ramularia collo-cygni]|uniref:DOMON domain-containing protein n=1 Tax=Ramularia collo-cygni TaxID=112498 RepID=A0A2D3VAJ2_9PEZI|nr:uncharacterized protein RCC_07674 [Ramularia collo-cygni]CZT21807.1 uncharacterized protein RCC_07674 [Ramularia collo-cygni]